MKEVIKVRYVKFWWNDGRDDIILAFPDGTYMEKVKKLLDEYRERNPEDYNISDFIEYLEKNDIFVEVCEPEESIYF